MFGRGAIRWRGRLRWIALLIVALALGLWAFYDVLPLEEVVHWSRRLIGPRGAEYRLLTEEQMPLRRVPEVPVEPLEFAGDSDRVVLLGLDGFDWRLAEPLIQAGLMPNLKRLLSGGAAGLLQTDVADSPVSWTTIATGKNLEHHGIAHSPWMDTQVAWWIERNEPQDLKVRRIWEIARERGRTIAVYDYYFSRPRPAGEWGWITRIPPSAPDELPPGLSIAGCFDPQYPVEDADHLSIKLCLTGRRPTDLTVILVKRTDSAGHYYMLSWLRRWHPEMFQARSRDVNSRGLDGLAQTYGEIDAALGNLWSALPAGAHLLICSDHGFGPPQDDRLGLLMGSNVLQALNVERDQLEQRGAMFANTACGALQIRMRSRQIPVSVAHWKGRLLPESSIAVLEELTISAAGGQADGWAECVQNSLRQSTGAGYDLLDVRRSRLELHVAPRRELLYQALYGDQWLISTTVVYPLLGVADHGPEDSGVVLLVGPRVRPGARLENARLVDVTPTLLYLLGLPVAQDMDGRVLTEAFTPEALSARPLRSIATYEIAPPERDGFYASDVDPQTIGIDPDLKLRLRSLGYLQ